MNHMSVNQVDLESEKLTIGIYVNKLLNKKRISPETNGYALRLADAINRSANHRALIINEVSRIPDGADENKNEFDNSVIENHSNEPRSCWRPDICLAPTLDYRGAPFLSNRPSTRCWIYNPVDLDQVASLVKRINKLCITKHGKKRQWWLRDIWSNAYAALKESLRPLDPSTWVRAAKKTVRAVWHRIRCLDGWDHDSLRLLGCFRGALGSSCLDDRKGAKPHEIPHIRLFLPIAYKGGVWELVRNMVAELASINHDRRALRFSLMVHKDQDISDFKNPENGFEMVCRAKWDKLSRQSLVWDWGATFPPDDRWPERFLWPTSDGESKCKDDPDAIFFMVDRFPGRVAPIKPYGVWIYDMIQERAPQGFKSESDEWAECYERFVKPNVRQASMVVVPSRCVGDDVQLAYQVSPRNIRTIPVACEPGKRFGSISSLSVDGIKCPYFLYPANAAHHKGADVVVKAIMAAKTLDPEFPMLVQCGFNSDSFSAACNDQGSRHAVSVRKLVAKSGLKEGTDIRFLGSVPDQQLKWLFENAIGVINAARFDNGSFSLIEADWFGCPIVSTDYPGVRELCDRFDLPARFVPMEDHDALAAELIRVWRDWKPDRPVGNQGLTGQQTERSARTQAERFYEVLREFGAESLKMKIFNSMIHVDFAEEKG